LFGLRSRYEFGSGEAMAGNIEIIERETTNFWSPMILLARVTLSIHYFLATKLGKAGLKRCQIVRTFQLLFRGLVNYLKKMTWNGGPVAYHDRVRRNTVRNHHAARELLSPSIDDSRSV